MGVGTIHARDLHHFVAECDRRGGCGSPQTLEYVADFKIRFDTKVDQSLPPFSEEYFRQQESLHEELAGRQVGPEEGEQYPLPDLDNHVNGCNPCNLPDIRFVSRQLRTIHTCLMLADLQPRSKVLDMGAGWGISSEAMAFSGAAVTAVDINPVFVELIRRRAARLGLPIEAVRSEFDHFESDERFDMMLFFECLHHSRKPWDTLAHLCRLMAPDGKVIFAGEPVNDFWWKNWGMRLDYQSIYCIRKHGWWESGWSTEFITQCFKQAGWSLNVYDHLGLNNGQIGIAVRQDFVDRVKLNLSMLPTTSIIGRAREKLRRFRSSRVWRMAAPLRAFVRSWRSHSAPLPPGG